MNDTVEDNDNAITEPQAGAMPNHQINPEVLQNISVAIKVEVAAPK